MYLFIFAALSSFVAALSPVAVLAAGASLVAERWAVGKKAQ